MCKEQALIPETKHDLNSYVFAEGHISRDVFITVNGVTLRITPVSTPNKGVRVEAYNSDSDCRTADIKASFTVNK